MPGSMPGILKHGERYSYYLYFIEDETGAKKS